MGYSRLYSSKVGSLLGDPQHKDWMVAGETDKEKSAIVYGKLSDPLWGRAILLRASWPLK